MTDWKRGDKATSKPVVRGPYKVTIRKMLYGNWKYDDIVPCSSCRKGIKIGDLYGYSLHGCFCLACVEKPEGVKT